MEIISGTMRLGGYRSSKIMRTSCFDVTNVDTRERYKVSAYEAQAVSDQFPTFARGGLSATWAVDSLGFVRLVTTAPSPAPAR